MSVLLWIHRFYGLKSENEFFFFFKTLPVLTILVQHTHCRHCMWRVHFCGNPKERVSQYVVWIGEWSLWRMHLLSGVTPHLYPVLGLCDNVPAAAEWHAPSFLCVFVLFLLVSSFHFVFLLRNCDSHRKWRKLSAVWFALPSASPMLHSTSIFNYSARRPALVSVFCHESCVHLAYYNKKLLFLANKNWINSTVFKGRWTEMVKSVNIWRGKHFV